MFANGKRIARRDISTGAVHYFIDDHLGSTSVVVSSTGTVENRSEFAPYGGEWTYQTSLSNQNYKFTGKERDSESQLDNFGARYYGSALGRFMTPDWAEKPTTVPYAVFGDPQTLNLYAYVENAPMNKADADGHGPPGDWSFGPDCNGGGQGDCHNKNQQLEMQEEIAGLFNSEVNAYLARNDPPAANAPPAAQKNQQGQQVLVVSSDTPHERVTLNPAGVVQERDIDYTVGTMDEGNNFHRNISNNKPTITLDEKQTGGNDRPVLCSSSICSAKGTFEDNIRVSGPGKTFSITQTFHINGSKEAAKIYTMRDGKLISGTHAYVQATDKEVTVTYGP